MPPAPLRLIWFGAGALSLALGALGVVLPVLPTTPFVLVAVFAFARSAPRLATMLIEHRVFGPLIRDWRARGAIPPRAKAAAVGMMAATFALSLAMAAPPAVLAIQAVFLGSAAAFVLTRPDGAG